ncbi:hypothetical protein N9040_10090, partial [Akkermansiaceae bacterium]|nr:hypothetical protein [Akkermansiaceae bacterium]
SLKVESLGNYTASQLSGFFPDGEPVDHLLGYVENALDRVERCFSKNTNKYFRREGEVWFDHLHSDQYAMYLYFLANTMCRSGEDRRICDKIFNLNKALHGLNVYYEVELPDVFFLTHPVGTVLGRANYSDHLFVYQGCTIGNNHGDYPKLGEHVTVYTGASILGDCTVGRQCKIAANSILMDQDLEPNTIYIGSPQNFVIKENKSTAHVWK